MSPPPTRPGGSKPQDPPPPSFPALPSYLHQRRDEIRQSAPGHRFGLYWADWDDPGLTLNGPRLQVLKDNKSRALQGVAPISAATRKLVAALVQRQRAMAGQAETHVLELVGTSPLVTGLGQEHPVENGFSFLTPYGVPYLPGSGLKGAFRRAAEALAFQGELDILEVWWLFGFDAQSACFDGAQAGEELLRVPEGPALNAFHAATASAEARRQFGSDVLAWWRALRQPRWRRQVHLEGTLRFWDCFPRCPSLAVDILTPHHGDYYQGQATPHDSGQPAPSPFLVIPPEAEYTVIIEHRPREGAPALPWRELLDQIQQEALFQGLGGKTAVGYGQLKPRSARSRE